MLRAALITLALLMIPTSVAALSMPSQLGSLMSFPAITSGFDPTNTFSSGLAEYSPVVSIPSAGISSASPSISDTSLIPANIGSLTNGLSYVPVGSDSGFQWPSSSYNKWTANGVTTPSAITTASSPAPTQAQKDKALKIAATSPLCKQYNVYPDESWGCEWTDPSDGHTITVTTQVGTQGSSPYGNIWISVDLNTGKVTNGAFNNWNTGYF